MFFLAYLIFSVCLFHLVGRLDRQGREVLVVFYILTWVLFVGSQYSVGTDYESYVEKYTNIWQAEIAFRREPVFVLFIKFLRGISKSPQTLFYTCSLINAILFIGILKGSAGRKQYWVLVLVMITVSASFNNQFNGIRQYVSIFLITYAIVRLCNKDYTLAILFFVLSGFFHRSAYPAVVVFLGFHLLARKNILNGNSLIIYVLSCGIIALVSSHFSGLQEQLIGYTEYGEKYLNSEYLDSIDLKFILTKVIYLPMYIHAVFAKPYFRLNLKQGHLFDVGVLSYGMKLLCLSNTVTNRFGMYFELPMIFPISYLILFYGRKNKIVSYAYLLFVSAIYFAKVVLFPRGEYLYDSVFFY